MDVSPLTDAAQIPSRAGRGLTRCPREPTGELAPATKGMNVPDRPHERGRGQHADARNCLEACRDGMRAGDLGELTIEAGDLFLESVDFVDDERDRLTQDLRDGRVWIAENGRHATEHRPRALGDRVALFREQSSDGIDPGHTGRLPLRSHPMYRLERLLLNGFHRHGTN